MNIEIRKLTPDLAEAYARFFDETPYKEKDKEEIHCYCVTWRSDDTYTGDNDHWYPTREERRERAIRYVKDGKIQGYLACCGEKIVGWCNATADCLGGVGYLRSFWPIEAPDADVRVKSIFCFLIAPGAQRQGVATLLTERVCEDAARDGFDFVEAYVNEAFTDTAFEFRGPLAMYEKCGFYRCAGREGRVVVRKALK